MSREDQELLGRALAGDRVACRALADRLLDGIQREVAVCLQRAVAGTGRDPRQEVRDMVQDVLVLLFQHGGRELRRWDPDRGRTLDSFARLVTRRRVARILTQRRGNPWADLPTEPEHLDSAGEASLVERLEHRAQLEQVLLALTARMTARDQELFELLFVEERDPDDVAAQMSMTRGAVNAWSYRMRKQARAVVAQSVDVASSDPEATTKGVGGHGR